MNVAIKLLNSLGVKRNADPAAASTGGFNPTTVVTQQQGIFDRSQASDAAEEEDVNTDPTTATKPAEASSQAATTETPADAPKTGDGEDDGHVFEYNGVPVKIENKPEMVASFKEKGLDIDAVNKELFSKEGLSAGTKAKLDEAFGKMAVDMYLEGWKNNHDAMVEKHKLDEARYIEEMTATANEAAGGKWSEVLAWAQKGLTADEYKEYAEVINGGNKRAMQLAIKDLTAKSGLAGTASDSLLPPTMSPRATPLSATGAVTTADDYAMSAKQYREAITSKEYYKNPSEYDKRREAGMAKGI